MGSQTNPRALFTISAETVAFSFDQIQSSKRLVTQKNFIPQNLHNLFRFGRFFFDGAQSMGPVRSTSLVYKLAIDSIVYFEFLING